MNLQFLHYKSARPCRLLLASLVFGLTTQAHAVCYVDGKAAGANNGSTWGDAYTNPQFALLDSKCSEIWVAKGVYKPTLGTNKTISFNIPPGTAIYGGFAGTESSRNERNPAANTTILSGDIDNNDANAGGTDIDDSHYDIVGNNSSSIVEMDGSLGIPITSSTVLDGFTITGGDFGAGCDGSHPAGMCSPLLTNLVISGNAYFGFFAEAIDGGDVSPTFQNVIFRGNETGISNMVYSSTSHTRLSDVTFVENDFGGFNNESIGGTANPILERVTFAHNAGGYSGYGGGFSNYAVGFGATANPSLTNVTFYGNVADYGGALANETKSGGVAEPALSNVTLYQNLAYFGGAIYSDTDYTGGSSAPRLQNAIVWGNSVFDGGSGAVIFSNAGGTASFDHSIVQDGCPALTTCVTMPLTSDPLLGSLADNGGITKTLMPSTDSPAIDAGDDAFCTSIDQRGMPRPQGAHCDIGAVERQTPEDIIFRGGFDL